MNVKFVSERFVEKVRLELHGINNSATKLDGNRFGKKKFEIQKKLSKLKLKEKMKLNTIHHVKKKQLAQLGEKGRTFAILSKYYNIRFLRCWLLYFVPNCLG